MRVRLPRVRFRLWWLMVAVVVIAALFAAWHYQGLSRLYQEKAKEAEKNRRYSLQLASEYADRAAESIKREGPDGASRSYNRDSDWHRRRAAHFETLRQKYERAASLPWLPIDRDPPIP